MHGSAPTRLWPWHDSKPETGKQAAQTARFIRKCGFCARPASTISYFFYSRFKAYCIQTPSSPTLSAMKTRDIAPFFATLKAANPMPVTELEYTSVFELLTAVLLSAQATDVSVNKATRRLFPVANTPQKTLALGLDRLESYIKTIGLYHSKARNLLATCAMLIEQHSGQVPRTREALEKLPGVGRKTANVVLNSAFGEAVMAVDTHIFRVGNRTGLAPGKNPLEVELKLVRRIPPEYLVDAHHWLILLGRYVCVARKPLCWQCAVAPYCDYKPKTEPPPCSPQAKS